MSRKFTSIILALTILILNIVPNIAYANTTVYVNEEASVAISASWGKPGAGFYFLSTGGSGPVGDPLGGNYVTSVSTTAKFIPSQVGNYTITLTIDVSDADGNEISVAAKTVTVKVVERPAPTPDPKPEPTPTPTPKPDPKPDLPQVDNTEKDKVDPKPPTKTPEEIESEELNQKMKTPLIREINIISDSERLKGERLLTIEPESQKFNYSGQLARNVDRIRLEVKPIREDVVLDYEENLSIEEGKSSIEVIIRAKQGKLEQEFKLELRKAEDSNFVIEKDSKKLRLIVDPYLDTAMEKLGFEKNLMNLEDQGGGFYYSLDGRNYAVVEDEENNGFIYLVDKDMKPVKEVFLISNSSNQVSILVNEELGADEKRTLNGNKYENQEIEISKILEEVDPTLKFNNQVGGWVFGENSIITHGLINKDEGELVYLDKFNNIKAAFVAFDQKTSRPIGGLAYVGFGLWIVTLSAFIAYVAMISWKKKQTI